MKPPEELLNKMSEKQECYRFLRVKMMLPQCQESKSLNIDFKITNV